MKNNSMKSRPRLPTCHTHKYILTAYPSCFQTFDTYHICIFILPSMLIISTTVHMSVSVSLQLTHCCNTCIWFLFCVKSVNFCQKKQSGARCRIWTLNHLVIGHATTARHCEIPPSTVTNYPKFSSTHLPPSGWSKGLSVNERGINWRERNLSFLSPLHHLYPPFASSYFWCWKKQTLCLCVCARECVYSWKPLCT